MSDFEQYTDEQGIGCNRVKSLIQEALIQRARHYQVIYALPIFFEGDQTGAAEDSKIFLDMARCFGVERESLKIPLSSPRLGGPGREVNDRVAALIKQGLQLDPEYGRVLRSTHTSLRRAWGHWRHGLIFNADSQYPRPFNYDRTINPKLEIYNYLSESLEIFDCNPGKQRAEVLSAVRVREGQSAFPKGIDSAGKVTLLQIFNCWQENPPTKPPN